MSAELISAIAGGLLSLGFSYIPGLNVWFAGLESIYKRLIMAGLLLLVSAAVFGLGCTSWAAGWGIEATCDQPGLQVMIGAFIAALVANQATYQISPETSKVRTAKAA